MDGSDPRVVVVGPGGPDRDGLAEAVRNAGVAVSTAGPDPAELEEAPADLAVALGWRAVSALGRAGAAALVLAVDAGPGLPSVDPAAVGPAVGALLDREPTVRRVPVLGIEVDGTAARAVFDLLLATTEPARISEFSVRAGGRRVDRFRADGVVVATPAGSHGYARAASGPVLDPGPGVAVVPVAPFRKRRDRWVLDPTDGVELVVARDEADVSLRADGDPVGPVAIRTPLSVTVVDRLRVVEP